MVADQAWQSPVRDAVQRAGLHERWWSYGFCRMRLRGNRWSEGSHPVRNEREVILGDGEESAAEREPPVAWILDEES